MTICVIHRRHSNLSAFWWIVMKNYRSIPTVLTLPERNHWWHWHAFQLLVTKRSSMIFLRCRFAQLILQQKKSISLRQVTLAWISLWRSLERSTSNHTKAWQTVSTELSKCKVFVSVKTNMKLSDSYKAPTRKIVVLTTWSSIHWQGKITPCKFLMRIWRRRTWTNQWQASGVSSSAPNIIYQLQRSSTSSSLSTASILFSRCLPENHYEVSCRIWVWNSSKSPRLRSLSSK